MIQKIDISLIPSDNKPVINVSQFDNISRVLRFNVFDDVEMTVPHVFDLGDTTLLNIRKNDNNIVVITGVIVSDIDSDTQEITEQYLTFELTEQACACVGSNFGEVSITSGDDEVIGSCNFKLIVERSPLSGGVSSQTAIDNLTTQIEQITEEVIGDNYYDKEEIDGKFDDLDIPTKTSDLENDSGFITASDIPTIPTKTSQLTNDSGFITASDIPTIPTKTSQLTNDSGFITASDIPTIPTKTSQLTNDSGFTTIDDDATANDKTWSSEKISEELFNILPTGIASGPIANFNTAFAWPLEIELDFGANVSGVSAVNIYHFGGNLFDKNDILNGYINDANGNFIQSNNHISSNYITVKGGCNYFIKSSQTGGTWGAWYDENKEFISSLTNYSNKVKTAPSNACYARLTIGGNNIPGSNIDTFAFTYPSTDTDYHDYNPNSSVILINFDATYYNGGKLNIDKNGHISITAEGVTVELPDVSPIMPLIGFNNIFADVGDISLTYKDTIQNYIDTRVNTVSNRSLSMMRTLETLEKSVTLEKSEKLERGDNNDDNAR